MHSRYGGYPKTVGKVVLEPSEYCYVQYLPLAFPHSEYRIPENMKWVLPILDKIDMFPIADKYIYLTAKHFYINEGANPNRPGWHTDGFGTDDINFIWYDAHPTEFCVQDFWLSDDDNDSLVEMEEQYDPKNVTTYPVNTLLRLDEKIVHRVNESPFEGMRTFVKISVSRDQYNLKGNSHNYLFDYNWEMVDRDINRNNPRVNV